MFVSKEFDVSKTDLLIKKGDDISFNPAAMILVAALSHFGTVSQIDGHDTSDDGFFKLGNSFLTSFKRNKQYSLRFVSEKYVHDTGSETSIHVQSALGIYPIPFNEFRETDTSPIEITLGHLAYQFVASDIIIAGPDQGRFVSHLSEGGYFRLGSFLDQEEKRPKPQPVPRKFANLVKKVDRYVLDKTGIYLLENTLPHRSAKD